MGFKKRLWYTLRMYLIRSGTKRAEFAKKKEIFNGVGDNVMIMPRKIPLYPKLIRFHNNVRIASNVSFTTHDDIHSMLGKKYPHKKFSEKIGCIEIMDNVFIGSDSKIMYNVRIGPNAIVAAGSVVTKDVQENTIVGGVPARKIGTFDDFVKRKKIESNNYPEELSPSRQNIKKELIDLLWKRFEQSRG